MWRNLRQIKGQKCEGEMCKITRNETCEGRNVPLNLRGVKRLWVKMNLLPTDRISITKFRNATTIKS